MNNDPNTMTLNDLRYLSQKQAREIESLKATIRDQRGHLLTKGRIIDDLHKVIAEMSGRVPYDKISFTGISDHRCNQGPNELIPTFVNGDRIFRDHWREKNQRQSGLNGGAGTLEILLSPGYGHDAQGVFPISQRDATVATTVVQWLGTNCGLCFIQECEQKLKDEQERLRAEYELSRKSKPAPKPQ